MYLFDHLLVCTIIGFIASYVITSITRTETIMSFALGGIISDVIDKPLYGFDGFGRSLGHSIVIVSVVFLICMYIFRNDYKPKIISSIFFVTIFIHHLMDGMWTCIKVWIYPILGNPSEFCAPEFSTPKYIYLLATNMNSKEVVFAVASLILIALVVIESKKMRSEEITTVSQNP